MVQVFGRSFGLRISWALLALSLSACGAEQKGADEPLFPARPSREAFENFWWEEVSGAGLRFWSQSDGRLQVVADSELPGARLECDGVPGQPVLRVLRIDGDGPEALLSQLGRMPGWDASQECVMQEVASGRRGVRRFELRPAGACAEEFRRRSAGEPVPATCSGWGVGNSGMRYFELHANAPGRALFVEIGQDAPLFDEQSIVLLPDSVVLGGTKRVKGRLIIGHEVRSFMADNDTCEYWVIDRTGRLAAEYDRVTGGVKNGRVVEGELEVRDTGPRDEGFAAEYTGVYEVTKVVSLRAGQ